MTKDKLLNIINEVKTNKTLQKKYENKFVDLLVNIFKYVFLLGLCFIICLYNITSIYNCFSGIFIN